MPPSRDSAQLARNLIGSLEITRGPGESCHLLRLRFLNLQALSGIQKELVVPPVMDFRVSVVGGQKPLQGPIGQELYRIGKEALANAFRHSRASRVEFELEYSDSHLDLRVRDNGRGIDPEVLAKGLEGHWGLAGMRERAARIGGLLKIGNSTAAGTEIWLSIPGDLAFRLRPADPAKLKPI